MSEPLRSRAATSHGTPYAKPLDAVHLPDEHSLDIHPIHVSSNSGTSDVPTELAAGTIEVLKSGKSKKDTAKTYTSFDTALSVLVAIPAYNEERAIAKVVLQVKGYADRVLVVDDGSADMTAEIALALGATVVRHCKNQGYGAALRTIFEQAREMDVDRLVIIDGDGQHYAEDIPRLLAKLEAEKADIATGSRALTNKVDVPLYRRGGQRVLDAATRATSGSVNVTDSQCGYRAYNRRAIQEITVMTAAMGASSEILARATNLGMKIVEVPINVKYEKGIKSHHNPILHAYDVLESIIWHVSQRRPLLYVAFPGFLMVGIACGLAIYTISLYNHFGDLSIPLAIFVFFFGVVGMIALFMGTTLNIISRMQHITIRASEMDNHKGRM